MLAITVQFSQCPHPVRDILDRAESQDRLSTRIQSHFRPLFHPADLAIRTDDPVLHLVSGASLGSLPDQSHAIAILRMDIFEKLLQSLGLLTRQAEDPVRFIGPGQLATDDVQMPVTGLGNTLSPVEKGLVLAQSLGDFLAFLIDQDDANLIGTLAAKNDVIRFPGMSGSLHGKADETPVLAI